MFAGKYLLSLEKTLNWERLRAGGEGMTEDEMVGWHHRLSARELEQAPGNGERQRRLVCCSPWGCKESDTAERLNNNNDEKVFIKNTWL